VLFANSQLVGTFKGFNEKGLEFAAEIIAPYDASMLDRPQLGQFLLIELGSPEEAALGRITRFVPSGLLATAEGEDYVNTMQRRKQEVPEDLKQQRLKYRVQIKLLGAVRKLENKVFLRAFTTKIAPSRCTGGIAKCSSAQRAMQIKPRKH
jgi:uncharacterized protein